MTEITLDFLARQLDRVLNELGNLRDEAAVQGATTRRLDATVSALVDEFRLVHKFAAIAQARRVRIGT